MFVRWLVYLHVLSTLTFFLAHGASAAVAFKLQKERDVNRIRAMLDLSGSTFAWMGISLLMLGITGILLAFLVHLWDRIYIWISIVLMIVTVVYMAVISASRYSQLRQLVGLPYRKGNKDMPAEPPSGREALETLLKKSNLLSLVISGYVIPAVVLWLMMFKPF